MEERLACIGMTALHLWGYTWSAASSSGVHSKRETWK